MSRPDYKQEMAKVFAGCGLAAPLGASGDELMSADLKAILSHGGGCSRGGARCNFFERREK